MTLSNCLQACLCSGLNLANDGTENDFIHCLKKGQSCEAGRQKVNSQLPISGDEKDAVNPFISPSDKEDANEEMNVIKDERDEEIINCLSCVKEKSYINNTLNL